MSTSMTSSKTRANHVIGGGVGFFDEIGSFEMETPSVSSIAKGIASVFEDAFSLSDKLSIGGQTEIDFNRKKAAEVSRQKEFYQDIENQKRAKEAKDRMFFEEEINDISTNMSTEEKNRLLHYQASYKDNRSVYQRAELRRKIIEERKKVHKQKTEASIAQTKPAISAMNAAFEGGSGSQGSGTANLSAQATG